MVLLSILDILGVDEMKALDLWWGWKRKWQSWKEKGVGKTRAKGYPEKDTVSSRQNHDDLYCNSAYKIIKIKS